MAGASTWRPKDGPARAVTAGRQGEFEVQIRGSGQESSSYGIRPIRSWTAFASTPVDAPRVARVAVRGVEFRTPGGLAGFLPEAARKSAITGR